MNKWERLENLCAKHDWFFAMSDDFHVNKSGTSERREIETLAKELAFLDNKKVCSIWNKYAPAQMRVFTFLPVVKPLEELYVFLGETDAEIEEESNNPEYGGMKHKVTLQVLQRKRRGVLRKIEERFFLNEKIKMA